MKTPIDSAAAGAGATTALLNANYSRTPGFVMLDLWAITLNGGTVVRWHGGAGNPLLKADKSYSFTHFGSQSAVADGTYLKGPPIDRGKISTKLGLEVATLDMKIIASAGDLINGSPVIPFAQGRGFDGATVVLYRAFLANWSSGITGVTIAFSGRVTALKDMTRAGFTLTVSAWTVLLNVNMGPDVFQAGCLNTHYDANCGLAVINSGGLGASPPQNSWNGTVGASPTPTATSFAIAGAAAAMADHYFDQGTVKFTSGANTGLQRAVKSYVGGVMTFAFGFPVAPAATDGFTAIRGCDLNFTGTTNACTTQRTLLDAEEHFRGQPFTPPATQGVL